jgi:hypothetical protein
MGTGSYFSNAKSSNVMVQVGNSGDSGVLEIVEMLFIVKGPTVGAVLIEWNVYESTPGSGKSSPLPGICLLWPPTKTHQPASSRHVGLTFPGWWCHEQQLNHP